MSHRPAPMPDPSKKEESPKAEVRWGSILHPERNVKRPAETSKPAAGGKNVEKKKPATEAKEAPEERPWENRARPVLLAVDDDPSVLHTFTRIFRDVEIDVVTAASGDEAVEIMREKRPDVVVLDVMLSDDTSGLEVFQSLNAIDNKAPVIFITATGDSELAIEAMKLGAYDYLLKPLDFAQMRTLVARAVEIRRMMHIPVGVDPSHEADDSDAPGDQLVGRCEAMQEVYKAIGRVAPQNVTVLIRGPSGTGKELVARALYQHSPRAAGPFLAVNCAAIPETLLESELFGHEKGSFTGADAKRIGKFEQCSGGTIFLDEIGDMTPLVQSKVLRLLQEQKFERVGGNETVSTDVRIIAATHRDLEKMVAEGEFRTDLYYRLNGFMITLPALKDRAGDIKILVDRFLRRASRELGKPAMEMPQATLDVLMAYRWPGNVRELQSVIKQGLLHATGPVLMPEFLPEHVRQNTGPGGAPLTAEQGAAGEWQAFIEERLKAGVDNLYAEALETMERDLIARVLSHANGNQSHAAKVLGITRGSLRNKIRLLGISIGNVVSVEDE